MFNMLAIIDWKTPILERYTGEELTYWLYNLTDTPVYITVYNQFIFPFMLEVRDSLEE